MKRQGARTRDAKRGQQTRPPRWVPLAAAGGLLFLCAIFLVDALLGISPGEVEGDVRVRRVFVQGPKGPLGGYTAKMIRIRPDGSTGRNRDLYFSIFLPGVFERMEDAAGPPAVQKSIY